MTKAVRALRIGGFALAFVIVFTISQQATLARSGETVPGTLWAIGALSVFFLVGAFATESSQGPEANVRKDLLWGLGCGGVLAIAAHLVSA
jgi:peptidoglycan/LPS O-acetylase OafA/YrhL